MKPKFTVIPSLKLVSSTLVLVYILLLYECVNCTEEIVPSSSAELAGTTESAVNKKSSRAPAPQPQDQQDNEDSSSSNGTGESASLQKCTENCLPEDLISELSPKCPEIFDRKIVDRGFVPYNKSVGEFILAKEINDFDECIRTCCGLDGYTAVEMIDTTCFFINKGQNVCYPYPINKEVLSLSYDSMKLVYLRIPQPVVRNKSTCEVGIDTLCQANEVCRPVNSRSRNGHCECDKMYIRNRDGECIAIPAGTENSVPGPSQGAPESETTSPILKTLEVVVESKNITLKINEVALSAYVDPEETTDNPYSYTWSLVSHPGSDPAQIEGQTTNTLKLSKLIQGTYMFLVTVTNPKGDVNGTANASINVFPKKRVNQPPIAKSSPSEQSVQLPTSSAVLDAGSSTDDDKIISYKWELQAGPIEYKFDPPKQNANTSTLQVKDLIPGTYVFKVTVEDSDHVTNSTTANITVRPSIDYPPTANAGDDVVIFLPQNVVVLNGNASSDDKKIVQWEWKAIGDNNAVDIQDTHTPYLKLSQLQEGIYQFELRVTDEAGQQSNPSTVKTFQPKITETIQYNDLKFLHFNTVHVFVKPPSGNAPTADAGKPQTIALPQNWVILDASESKADSKVVKWKWTQLSGPNNATILTPEEVKTNVTNLTKGDYEFQVQVENDVKLSANATVKITVAQKINEPPKANAGTDVVVTLPISLVEVNGGASTDDVKVTNWQWSREPNSAVAGTILGKSDTNSVLQLTDLIPGKYLFNLTVRDEQGLRDSDTMILTVQEDPQIKNLVEIVVGVPLTSLTETDKETFLQQITLLLRNSKPVFHHITSQVHSGLVVVSLYSKKENGEIIPALTLAAKLRDRLHQHSAIFGFPVLSVDTVLCLDSCSGHGKCSDISNQRVCVCDAFWMANYSRYSAGGTEWSKIYVVVIACLLLIILYVLLWSLLFLYRRSRRGGGKVVIKDAVNSRSGRLTFSSPCKNSNNRRHNHNTSKKQYTLLEPEEIDLEETGIHMGSDDSTSDSDVSLVEVKRTNKGSSVVIKNNVAESGASSGPPRRGILSSGSNGIKRNGILKQPKSNVKT